MPGGDGKMAGDALTSTLARDVPRLGLDSVEAARFDAVVRRSSMRLIHMLDAAFLDRELSVDAAQEAYVQLYLHWNKVGDSAEPEAWLYRVAVNRCKDQRRRLARGAKLLARLLALSEAPPADQWETAGDSLAVLRRLPLKQRTAAALFYAGDLSIPEIARIMAISEGAVNSHLNRARRALKDTLEASR